LISRRRGRTIVPPRDVDEGANTAIPRSAPRYWHGSADGAG
jgi:hypothetical protein